MKKIDLKDKETLKKVLSIILTALLIILLCVFFYRGLQGKSLKIWTSSKNDSSFDIANNKDYIKYENNIEANFEGKQVLNFSFLYKTDLKVEQGKNTQAKWFKILDASSINNVTLYFTYEGGRGWSVEDYINQVLNINDIKIQDVKFTNNSSADIKYVYNEKENTEYYIEAVKNEKGESWLSIVENLKADNDQDKNIAKDIIRSMTFK